MPNFAAPHASHAAPSRSLSPDEIAARLVRFADDDPPGMPTHIVMSAPGSAPVRFGPFADPAVARLRREEVRRFVAAAIQAGIMATAWAAAGSHAV